MSKPNKITKPSDECIKECGWKYDTYKVKCYFFGEVQITNICRYENGSLKIWDKDWHYCPNCGNKAKDEK